MTTPPRAATTTILFTDLVNSTELLQRAGDESGQRIFRAHHQLLKDAVAATGGHEVKWLGDGLMVAFPSAADGVRCAIAMQQLAQRPIAGERLAIRVGLNAGEALRDETDYFGTPVVVARRLCERAAAGQILCSSVVTALLSGRQAFCFRASVPLELKGLSTPVAACEVLYEQDQAALVTRTPFVGRTAELARLNQKLRDTRAGHGALMMLVGEPGIGKTRTTEEFAESGRQDGTIVLCGRCFEGEWAPPYGPFAEAIADYARTADPEVLRHDLGLGAAPLARLVAELRERLPDIPEPVPLQPDEERFRLFDAVSQFLIATSKRAPVLLVLDDLHWADKGTIALLRHVARFAPRHRLLLLGAYRDVELDRQHPLADALAALRREVEYERIVLKGLDEGEVGTLLSTMADQDVNPALIQAISAETDGNPFFIREVLIHLVEEGKLYREGGQWKRRTQSIADLGIPEGVRQVITRRLSRLSADANRLLAAASAFNGGFHFDVVTQVAGLQEMTALDAVDQALAAQLLRSAAEADTYDFTHALIRHTLYGEMNPSRQVRLHRQIAEAMEAVYANRAAEHAGEIAEQYYRSAALPNAERGVVHCLTAAQRAEQAAAFEDAAAALRMALELLPAEDPARPRLLARLGLALAWSLQDADAVRAAGDAAEALAASEGHEAAANYLADAADALWTAQFRFAPLAPLVEQGLRHIGARRDLVWVRLLVHSLVRSEANDPDNPGIYLDSPERREMTRVTLEHWEEAVQAAVQGGNVALVAGAVAWESRTHVLERGAAVPPILVFWAGEYAGTVDPYRTITEFVLQQGRVAFGALGLTAVARIEGALGQLAASEQTFARARDLASRVSVSPFLRLQMAAVPLEHMFMRGEGYERGLSVVEELLGESAFENRWVMGTMRAAAAATCAHLGRRDDALRWLEVALPAIERGPGWALNYTILVYLAADALWTLGVAEHTRAVERNLREKTIAPDFRYPHTDARLAMARLCVLQGRYDEAVEWFAKARAVLDEQGARPLRAITDFDEALMYARRGAPGDRERGLRLLDLAVPQFEAIGMPGWMRRAHELRRQVIAGEAMP